MLINKPRLRVSRRDAVLVLFGLVYLLLGYSLFTIPDASKPLLHASLRVALEVAPIEVYGGMWIACGILAIIGGLRHRWDWLGFGVAVFMPLVWSVAYYIAQITDNVPRSWVSGTIFALLGVSLAIIAGMPDPQDPKAQIRSRKHKWRR